MNAEELNNLVRRYWEAEAAGRSTSRDERLRVMSWNGDLYRIDEEVEAILRDQELGDRFLLAAAQCADRPDEDRVVAWLGGSTIEDAINHGDSELLNRLVGKGLSGQLAIRIREFIA